MGKSLHQLSEDLKEFMIAQSQINLGHSAPKVERYHNLTIIMDVVKDKIPCIIVRIGISEAKYEISSGERMDGSLGVEERYIQRWFMKNGIIENLNECWVRRVKNRGKITDIEE